MKSGKEIKSEPKKVKESHPKSNTSFIAAIIVNLIILYLFNYYLSRASFLTSSFAAVLNLFNISFLAHALINFIYIFYHPKWFMAFSQLVLNVFSLIVFYLLLIIFPFSLNQSSAQMVLIVIYIIIFGISISILVEAVKLFMISLKQSERRV